MLLLLPASGRAGALQNFLVGLMDAEEPWTAEASVQFQEYLPYGEGRLQALNALWKHLTLRLSGKASLRSVTLLADGKETSLTGVTEGDTLWLSFSPEVIYTPAALLTATDSEEDASTSDFPEGFEDLVPGSGSQLRWLEDGASLLERLPDLYAEYTGVSETRTKLRDVGTSTRKVSVTLPKEQVEAGLMDRMTEACENGSLKAFLSSLVFSGKQRFTLYLDENGGLLKANWSGRAGTEDSLRQGTLEWRLLREEERILDELVVKLPAVSGSDKDILTLERETLSPVSREAEAGDGKEAGEASDSEKTVLSLTWTRNRSRQKSVLKAGLEAEWGERLSLKGNAEVTVGKVSDRVSLEADLAVKDSLNWQGKVRTLRETGQSPVLDALWTLEVHPGAEMKRPASLPVTELSALSEEEAAALKESLQIRFSGELLRVLLSLPEEDLLFLNDELDPDDWQRIRQSAEPASEGGPVE